MKIARHTVAIAAATLLLPGVIWAADAADQIQAEGAYARAVPPGQPNSAVFMSLSNSSAADHAVTGAESDSSEVVELHTHTMDGGMMRMRQIERIDVPAGETVTLEPGGLHVMLIGLKKPLVEGETVAVTLVYDDGSRATLDAPVKRIEHTMHGQGKNGH
jgi:copper(I)-binding protein